MPRTGRLILRELHIYSNIPVRQERELQLANASMHESKKEAEKHQRRVQELREQIQSDDRLERAENSLKNTQDRADELEFQLSKLKQVGLTEPCNL